jgi:hypothetical protein
VCASLSGRVRPESTRQSGSKQAASSAGYLGTEHFDSEDIQGLTAYILRTHVDDAFQAKPRADGGGGNAMLAGTGLSDNARLPNPAGK